MNPEESIARLSLYTEPGTWVLGKYDIRAIQLGIEALRFRQRWEDRRGQTDFPLLPGETKE